MLVLSSFFRKSVGQSDLKSTLPRDSGILRRSLAGDPEAWRHLVRTYSPLVYRIALGTGVSPEDAEDVTQSVWVVLLERGHAIRDPAALPGWLATTSRRIALQLRAQGRARPTEPLPIDLASADPSAEMLLEREQTRERVRQALQALPLRCRTLLGALFRDEKPNYEETGETLGLPHGSIGPTRARCLAHLYRILTRDNGS